MAHHHEIIGDRLGEDPLPDSVEAGLAGEAEEGANKPEFLPLATTSNKRRNLSRMSELVFEVTQEEDGGFCAECLSKKQFHARGHMGGSAQERAGSFARLLF